MIADVFLDTNVLVYAAIGSGKDEPKRQRALNLIESEKFATSAQVLQEFFVTVVKKATRPFTQREAMDWVGELTVFPCQPIDHGLVRIAIELSARYQISYWDAAIIAAAETLGCRFLYSEDLNDGQSMERSRLLIPFKSSFIR